MVVPKEHICCANAITADNSGVVAHCFEVIARICKDLGVDSYRIVNNCGDQAGQTVKHLHFHVLAGRDMTASGLKKKANRRISKNIHPRGWIFLSEQEVRRITAPIPFCTMCACRRRDT